MAWIRRHANRCMSLTKVKLNRRFRQLEEQPPALKPLSLAPLLGWVEVATWTWPKSLAWSTAMGGIPPITLGSIAFQAPSAQLLPSPPQPVRVAKSHMLQCQRPGFRRQSQHLKPPSEAHPGPRRPRTDTQLSTSSHRGERHGCLNARHRGLHRQDSGGIS